MNIDMHRRLMDLTLAHEIFDLRGDTFLKLNWLFKVASEDLTLAKLIEAHWDAHSILQEVNKKILPNQLYAVWASEVPNKPVLLSENTNNFVLNGTKNFCSGAGIVQRALISVKGESSMLVDVDFNLDLPNHIKISAANWHTQAFSETHTASVTFIDYPVNFEDVIQTYDGYSSQTRFWENALRPAACWGGAANALVGYARSSARRDTHTLAHLGAMEANVMGIEALLKFAADKIDSKNSYEEMRLLALKVRHLIEQSCTDILRRFARAYGPYPLACERSVSKTYQELDLFLRQNHAERDLEQIGKMVKGLL